MLLDGIASAEMIPVDRKNKYKGIPTPTTR